MCHKFCAYCGTTWMLQSHHIIYKSHGGIDGPSNEIPLCAKCHVRAHTSPVWMIMLLRSYRCDDWQYEDSYQYLMRTYNEAIK